MYIPSIGVISHYFQRRRTLIVGIVTTVGRSSLLFMFVCHGNQGSAFGGAIDAIMLNNLFHGPVGFNSGVKASAALISGLLIISVLLMKPRYSHNTKKTSSIFNSFKVFLRDSPYVILILG